MSTGWHVVAGAMYARTKPNAPSSILAVPQQASTAEAHDLGRWARLRAPPLLRYEAAGRQGKSRGPAAGEARSQQQQPSSSLATAQQREQHDLIVNRVPNTRVGRVSYPATPAAAQRAACVCAWRWPSARSTQASADGGPSTPPPLGGRKQEQTRAIKSARSPRHAQATQAAASDSG